MSAKELLIDFLNLIFAIIIVGLTILYFVAGDNFENFKNILQSLAPLGLFGVLLLVALKINRGKIKKRRSEGNMDMDLSLNFMDKTKIELFVFSLPMIICLIAWIMDRIVSTTNLFQAIAVFLIAYWFRWWLLSKEKL